MLGGSLWTPGGITTTHLSGRGAAPTTTGLPASMTSAALQTRSTDLAGAVALVTAGGGGPLALVKCCRVLFSVALAAPPTSVLLTLGNTNDALTRKFAVNLTTLGTDGFDIIAGENLAAGSSYFVYYFVVGS